jgi:hypothetical protein
MIDLFYLYINSSYPTTVLTGQHAAMLLTQIEYMQLHQL